MRRAVQIEALDAPSSSWSPVMQNAQNVPSDRREGQDSQLSSVSWSSPRPRYRDPMAHPASIEHPPWHLAATILASASLASCSGGVAVYPLAVGARGTLPTWNGPCDTAHPRGDAVTLADRSYVAVRGGDVELSCRDGAIRLEAREVAALTIEGPASVGPEWTTYRLVAHAEGGRELALGDAEVAWTLSPALERDSACHGHLVAACDPPSVVRVRVRGAGETKLEAELGRERVARVLDPP